MHAHTLIKRLRPHRRQLKHSYGLKTLALLDLWEKGKQAGRTPVRLAVEFCVAPSAFAVVRLQALLEQVLGRDVSLILRQPVPEQDTHEGIGRQVVA